MNPVTGTFHPIEAEAAAAAQQIADGTIGKDWPVFTVGETIEIKSYDFTIQRINRGSIVVRPVPTRGYDSPRILLNKMTRAGA